tara:strand:+ start:51 stop:476 length:426 start_codon:yes stop_codon:yes gene_type:complete
MSYTVYTFGYSGKTIQQLDLEVERLGAVVIDVRIQPYGNPVFNRSELQQRYGPKYVWIREFGNKNYKTGGPTEFVDVELGARKLGSIMADGTPVILLCVCENQWVCHRTDLAKRYNEELGWEICHLPYVEPKRESGYLFSE